VIRASTSRGTRRTCDFRTSSYTRLILVENSCRSLIVGRASESVIRLQTCWNARRDPNVNGRSVILRKQRRLRPPSNQAVNQCLDRATSYRLGWQCTVCFSLSACVCLCQQGLCDVELSFRQSRQWLRHNYGTRCRKQQAQLSQRDRAMLYVISLSRSLELGAVSCSPSIVTMALSCIVSEIKRDIGRKSLSLHSTPPLGRSEYCHSVWCRKTRMVWLPNGEKMRICLAILTEYRRVTDRRTDRRMDRHLATE